MARARFGIVTILAAAAVFAVAKPGPQLSANKAWSVLAKTMENHRRVPCKCLIWRRDMMQLNSPLMEMWTEQSADGELKLTVLSPLSEQGVTALDDGHQWITYRPDDNRLIIESSPRRENPNFHERIALAEKNYDLVVEPGQPVVAGRKTYCFLAVAKHAPMPARRYCIDKVKDFLLRAEVLNRHDCTVMLDTKAIEFPSSIPKDDFELEPHENTHVQTFSAPETVSLTRSTEKQVGFKPCMPEELPFGFAVEQPQMVEGKNGKFIAVRITDGLVGATVYEWNAKRNAGPEGASRNDRSANGVKLRLVGDVPDAVFTGLIDTFVKDALKRLESSLLNLENSETLGASRALNSSEESNQIANTEDALAFDPQNTTLILIEYED